MAVESSEPSHSHSEFWTVVTDFLLSAVCASLALQLQRRISSAPVKQSASPPRKLRVSAADAGDGVAAAAWWVRVLWVSSLSTGLGAIYHGVFDVAEQDTPSALLLWKAVLVTIHITGFCLCRSLACLCRLPLARAVAILSNIKLLLGTIIALFLYSEIIIPIADYTFALLLWTAMSLVSMRTPWAPLMLLGIALSVTASLVQVLKLKPSESFNHNDLYAAPLSRAFPAVIRTQIPCHSTRWIPVVLQVLQRNVPLSPATRRAALRPGLPFVPRRSASCSAADTTRSI